MINFYCDSNALTFIDGLEILAAFGALIISIFSIITTYRQNKKVLNITLKSEYFKKIFDDHLLKNIPKSRDCIVFDKEGNIKHLDILSDAIVCVWQDAAYFKYSDNDFYTKLKIICNRIEDFLMNTGNRKLDMDEQATFHIILRGLIEELYEYITGYQFGGN